MMRLLIVALALLAGLILMEHALDSEPAPQSAQYAPRRLVPIELSDAIQVAALTCEAPGRGERFVYVQRDGVWRCMNAHGALGLTDEISALAGMLVGAVGELRTTDPERQTDFGFDGDEMWTVGLHGARILDQEDADRLLAFDLGTPLTGAGEGRVFIRPVGTTEVYEIGSNPRARLDRPASDGLPPLLDRRVMAGDFPGQGEGVVRAFIDWADERSLELFLRDQPADRVLPGRAAREWIVVEKNEESICLPFRIAGWQSFLFHVGYEGFAKPAQRTQLGFAEGPVVRISLFLSDGTATELEIGRRIEGGGAFVWNRKTNMLCLVAAEHVALFAPTAPMLCEPGNQNPWESWLRQ